MFTSSDEMAERTAAASPDNRSSRGDRTTVLAAERTFLAWTRTCLNLLATGTAVGSLPGLPHRALRGLVGLACAVATLAVVLAAHYRWRRSRRVLHDRGGGSEALVLTGVVLLVAVTLAMALTAQLLRTAGPHAPVSSRGPAQPTRHLANR